MKLGDTVEEQPGGARSPRCVLDARATLGESPLWSDRDQCLYWVGIGDWPAPASGGVASALHRYTPATGQTRHWHLPQSVGSFAMAEDGSALLALAGGLYRMDLDYTALTLLAPAPYDGSVLRFNDGRCDPRGRFWVGTCQVSSPEVPSGAGGLYRYDGHALDLQLHGISAANGLAWSPDGGTMYFADSRQRTVWAFDYDLGAGRMDNRRPFIHVAPGTVLDGAAVDVEGGYWIALYDAGKVGRYLPDGRLDREIMVPVSKPTMVAFGGPRLETLYITSAAHRLSNAQREAQPLAGGVFAFEPGIAGLPSASFSGAGRACRDQSTA